MKRLFPVLLVAVLISACSNNQTQLKKRALELCAYIPDHELLESSRGYMTEDFYAVLDTMFYRLPEHEAMDHEWLYYFVTGNGGTIADFEVVKVEQTDSNHALATISVRQVWEDGSFDESTDIEEHRLYMERVNGEWLISDFDEHKADCIRYIAINRHEQAVRQLTQSSRRNSESTALLISVPLGVRAILIRPSSVWAVRSPLAARSLTCSP